MSVLCCIAPATLLPFVLPQLHLCLSELSPYCSVQFLGNWFLSTSPFVCLQLECWECLPLSDLSLSFSQLQSLADLGFLPMLLWCCGLSSKKPLFSVGSTGWQMFWLLLLSLPGCLGDRKGTLNLAQMGEMSAGTYQRSHKNWKEDISAIFIPSLPPSPAWHAQGGATVGMSDLHNII